MKQNPRTLAIARAVGEALAFGQSLLTFDMLHNSLRHGYYYIPFDRERMWLPLPPHPDLFMDIPALESDALMQCVKNDADPADYGVLLTSRIHDNKPVSIGIQPVRHCMHLPWNLTEFKQQYLLDESGVDNIYSLKHGVSTPIDWDYKTVEA